jgi:hypothetical protein
MEEPGQARARVLAAALLCLPLAAQWLTIPTPGAPRTKDGKVDLFAPAPRKADGKPDLSGIWQPATLRHLTSLDADGVNIPFRPWALEVFRYNQATQGKDDPDANCTFPGVPRIDSVPGPSKILQYPGLTLILYEAFTTYRQIFTDGRTLPKDPNPTWMGYSAGRWEGDTFVVESAGFNDKTWLDNAGHPHTEALRVTERFRRRDFGHMDIEVTIDDPKAYLRPWTVTVQQRFVPDAELLEFVCTENNKDVQHLVGK